VANMLYLESPAGSGSGSGSSSCLKGGDQVPCRWDDVSQAEAYAHSLTAFYKAFPELAANDLYLTGESYFGQYGPNIANYILTHAPFNSTLPLKGIAAGNACWGGTATEVNCNGPNEEKNDIDMFHGKGLISKTLYDKIYAACDFGKPGFDGDAEPSCRHELEAAHMAVGPHNVYNIYDNCDGVAEKLKEEGKSMRWLTKHMRAQLAPHSSPGEDAPHSRQLASVDESGVDFTGGYRWSCGGMPATSEWITTPAVRHALHLKAKSGSRFGYHSSGPASITLWPFLAKNLRVLIYNGDADACVPYKGNEEWINMLVSAGTLSEDKAWRPWYTKPRTPPAGYVTTYDVSGAPQKDFSFATIRLAGHMVPTFQAAAALAFFERFLGADPL